MKALGGIACVAAVIGGLWWHGWHWYWRGHSDGVRFGASPIYAAERAESERWFKAFNLQQARRKLIEAQEELQIAEDRAKQTPQLNPLEWPGKPVTK